MKLAIHLNLLSRFRMSIVSEVLKSRVSLVAAEYMENMQLAVRSSYNKGRYIL
jgi:hypothetical protein